MQLVEIKKLDLVTNSAVIASGVMKDHKPVMLQDSSLTSTPCWRNLKLPG
ncbi:hypothetical protein SM107_003982 [Cronobacter sakazakii]|nr:hypothetical protein [Cronobacter sakazakii]